jgi:hypothetical protein
MSRALVPILLSSALLWGCVAQPPVNPSAQDSERTSSSSELGDWLNQLDRVEEMDPPEVRRQLESVDKSASVNQLFYFGALNQRLHEYGAWTVARDAFQTLQENQSLPMQQRQLAGVLRRYNQHRINAYSRYNTLRSEQSALRESLSQAESEKQQLEQKIQALTEVETAISTRQED